MKYSITKSTKTLVVTLDTESGKYAPRVTTFNDPNVILGNNDICLLENGEPLIYLQNHEIGLIDGLEAVNLVDAVSKIEAVINSLKLFVSPKFSGSVTPSDTPQGTDDAFWIATQAGTYTQFGNFVLPINTRAEISRVNGVFSVSMTALDISSKVNVSDIKTDLVSTDVNKPGSANNDRLLNENKANLIVEKNIFNKATATIGFTISQTTGVLTSNAVYDTSDFIPIVVGQAYKSNSETRLTTYFDINKNVVTGGSGAAITAFTTPTGVAYVRVSIQHVLLNTYQLEKGTVATFYEDYQKVIQPNEISKTISRKADLPDFNLVPKLFTGKNLFNKSALDVTLGYYVKILNGTTAINAAYNTTGYIPVTAGLQYTMSHPIGENAWYDINKVFISGFNATNPTTAPTNAVYARCSVLVGNWNIFQFEQSATATAFEAYSKTIRDNNGNIVKAESLTPAAITEVISSIPNNSIDGIKLINNSVTSDKTNFFENTKNLFNPYDTDIQLSKYIANNGVILTSASASVSGFIPITAGQTLFCNKAVTGGGYNFQYDINKVLIAGSGSNVYTITGVTGAAYVRFSISGTTLATIIANKVQIEIGSVATSYIPFSTIKADLLPPAQSVGNLVPVATDIQIPSTLYLTNTKIDLFFAPIVKNFFKKDKFVRLSATNALLNRHFTKLATITPTANGVATFTLYDDSYNIVSAKNANTVITPISKTGNLKTLFVGSSITYGSKYIEYLKTVCGAGVTFLGMRHITATGVQTEGRGGWGLANYFQPSTLQNTAYNGFYHPTTGRHWGSTAYWSDVMNNPEFSSATAGAYDQNGFKTAATNAGFLTTGKIAGAKLLANDIMYDNSLSSYIQWNGSAWNTITVPSTWGIDFVKYGTMWDILAPDLFFIAELATNDFRASSTDPVFTTWNAQVEQVLTALKVWNSSAKLALTINFSSLGGDNNGFEFQERNNYRMWQCRKNVITNFDNRVGDGIYLIDNGIGFDEDYGFDLSTDTNLTIPNALYTGSERLKVQTGNPHPNQEGNNLLGKCLVGIIQYLRA